MKKSKAFLIILVLWAFITIGYLSVVREINALYATCVGSLALINSLHNYYKFKEKIEDIDETIILMTRRINELRSKEK